MTGATANGLTAETTSAFLYQFQRRASETPSTVAFRHKRLGIWHEQTWAGYWDEVWRTADALLGVGVSPGDRVAIVARNRPEWLYSDLACYCVGAVSVGVPVGLPPNRTQEILSAVAPTVVFTDPVLGADVPSLEVPAERSGQAPIIVTLEATAAAAVGREPSAPAKFMSWDDLADSKASRRRESAHEQLLLSWDDFRTRAAEPRTEVGRSVKASQRSPDDPVAVIVDAVADDWARGNSLRIGSVISARSMDFALGVLARSFPVGLGSSDRIISLLPLGTMTERIFSIWAGVATGAVVHLPESPKTSRRDFIEVQPTVVVGGARMWRNVARLIERRTSSSSRFKRHLGRFLVERSVRRRMQSADTRRSLLERITRTLGDALYYRHLRRKIGGGSLRAAFSVGTEPLDRANGIILDVVGIRVRTLYGFSETAGPIATSGFRDGGRWVLDEPFPGVELALEAGDEVSVRHPGLAEHYLCHGQSEAPVARSDGWFHSGHRAERTDDGRWQIFGPHWYVEDSAAPVMPLLPIEDAIRKNRLIDDAVLVATTGDGLLAVIQVYREALSEWAQARGIQHSNPEGLLHHPGLLEDLRAEAEKLNTELPARLQINGISIADAPWRVGSGELSVSGELNRRTICDRWLPNGLRRNRENPAGKASS